jgi:Flp pilus assembly protein TadG
LNSALKNLREFVADEGGSQIAEAAFVLPLLFTILLAIMSFGRAFNVYSTITRAAQDGAVVAAQSNCATCGNNVTTASDVATAVTSALAASKVAPEQVATYILASEPTACAGLPAAGCSTDSSSKIRICRNVQLNSTTSTGPKQCGAIVSFQYPYRLRIPFASVSLTDIQMTAVAERQTEN